MNSEYRPLSEDEQAMHLSRLEAAERGTAFDKTRFDPDVQLDVVKNLRACERELLAPNGSTECDYGQGTAEAQDQIHTRSYGLVALLSAEHATCSWKIDPDVPKKTRKPSEPGTAALGAFLAREVGGTHMAMIGRQTGNANRQPYHPYKGRIRDSIRDHKIGAFISLHGMQTGLVSDLEAERPYDLLIGTGNNPNPSTMEAAQTILKVAEDLGLQAGVNKQFLVIRRGANGQYYQKVYTDGTPKRGAFVAPEYTTRAAAQRQADEMGYNLPTLQIELAGSMRVLPRMSIEAMNFNPIGPYLAYEALRRTIQLITAPLVE